MMMMMMVARVNIGVFPSPLPLSMAYHRLRADTLDNHLQMSIASRRRCQVQATVSCCPKGFGFRCYTSNYSRGYIL